MDFTGGENIRVEDEEECGAGFKSAVNRVLKR
jgi:hypothetical protein